MMDPFRSWRCDWWNASGGDGASAWDGARRHWVRRHVRRCQKQRLSEAAVRTVASLATGALADLPAPVAELVRLTLDELAP